MPKLVLEAGVELWKRLFDRTDNPWIIHIDFKNKDFSGNCFFCGGGCPNHEPNCVYILAKELVAADERGEVG